jgi:DNA-directed RNA polymerase subunit RPC12/RpoP
VRIPASKVYRAFPEFDRFDDQRCEAYIAYMNRSPGNYLNAVKIVLALLGVVGVLVWVGISVTWGDHLSRWLRPNTPRVLLDSMWLVCTGALVLVGCLVIALGLLSVRDAHMRSVLQRQLRGVRCQMCSYSLLGMPVMDGVVQCPECGDKFTIALRGLREEDFKVAADELPGLDELAKMRAEPPKPYEHVMDPSEKERILSAVRERRGTLTERSTPPLPPQG